MPTTSPLDRRGLAQGFSAQALWGLAPAFWPLLAPAGAIEILAHRIIWTLVLMAAVLALRHEWPAIRALSPRGWVVVTAAALSIAVNWGVYIYGVSIGQVLDAALGYYISPLVNVLLGVLVLRERPRPAQWVALGLAATAVVVIAVGTGGPPWLGLILAASFGLYGLLKKTVPLTSTASLTAEGIVLVVPALVLIAVLQATGAGTVGAAGPWHVVLLLSTGPVTAIPLLLYGSAARRIPLATLGVLTYVTPTMQFLWGWLVVGEAMPTTRWIGFALVWVALVIFTVDLLRAASRDRANALAAAPMA